MSASNMIGHIITVSSGLLVARWLLPEELGFYNWFSILTSYIILSQLGVPSGLSRELPYYIGRGDDKKSLKIAAVAHFYELALGLFLLFCCILASIWFILAGNYPYAAGVFIVGVTSFEGVYVTKYLMVLYRSNNDFNKLSLINIAVSVTAALSVVLVWKFAFYGLCLRTIMVFLVQFYLVWRWRPIDVRPCWDMAVFREIMRVGMPIYWVANVYSLWPVLQRTAVIAYLGVKGLGLYALALMVDNSMKIVTNSLAGVTFPKMAFAWGKGSTVRELIRLPMKVVAAVFVFNLVLATIGWFLLPVFVAYFLGNYIEGVRAAQWMVLVGVVSVFSVYSNIYMVIKRNIDRLISYIAAVAVWAISLLILLKWRGVALEIMPQSLVTAYLAMYVVNAVHFSRYARLAASAK